MSLGLPAKALMIFAVTELADPMRLRWSPAADTEPLVQPGGLIPGSAEAILAHYQFAVNPIATPPEVVWHGFGPENYSTELREG
ncbi:MULTISPECIES: hypothetical protein [Mycolicibacter]|uniref:Uncharacterized protein n=2 Tax=Mycolicibacter TaxID=1073531 RepID=A0ABU5XNA2_9MYCO|nr:MULTISPECIES: hypothetical protein [unclassified Mycolicibacter]MEB3023463.1 hypothetical protein [Mycolicibacter sp. MYC098]MEB3033806.1 hypothetical protein [Mycolicibacter sp. MYC340]